MCLLKRWIILIALLNSSMQSKGQAALLVLLFGDQIASENFHLSLDAGLNISSLPGLSQQQWTNGFYFGLGSFVKLNDKWALTPEFKPISPRGARGVKPLKDYVGVVNEAQYEISLNYIDVPVLIQYSPMDKWFISTGPQISFLTKAQQLATGRLNDGSEVDVVQEMKSKFNSLYFTIPIELGYRFIASRKGKGVNLKARYNLGLSEIFASEAYGSSQGSTIQIFLSLPFVNSKE